MPTVTYPIRKEPLYTITKEPCKRQPRYVLRYGKEVILTSQYYDSVQIRAVGHNAVRLGAPVIVAVESKS